ncbi:MAG: cytochrome P450, partial [Myxococcota bacterium]
MGGMEDPEAKQFHPTQGSLIGIDPPEHTDHRAIVNRGFTPRRIAAMEPRVRKLANELVSAFEPRRRCDLVEEFSNPIPVAMIAELLGLPAERRDDFKRWSGALIVGSTQIGTQINTGLFKEFREYISEVVEQRRREPGDDLVSLLVHAEEEGGILDTVHVVGFASLMLAAGSETTTNAIGNALLALQANPEQAALVREDPERRGLIYAGTESGVYVSFNNGQNWQPLQLNFPITPVTGMKVAHGDLIVSTQGRSFWILDDLSPLRQVSSEIAASPAHLYRPRDGYRLNSG